MPGLWRNDEKTKGGKYLVTRRDGSIPEWPFFVLGARDPAAPYALRAYAKACEALGMDSQYVKDVLNLAEEFTGYLFAHGNGDPTAPPHRKDDPETITKMLNSKGA